MVTKNKTKKQRAAKTNGKPRIDPEPVAIVIAAPNFKTAQFVIRGTSPYVQNRFSKKGEILMAQTATAKKTKKSPRDLDGDYQSAQHITTGGKHGIPASAFRSALISACRVAGFQMTKAKLSVFCIADDLDREDGIPLVHIIGKPERHECHVRLQSGVCSIAVRPMWREWSATVTLKWDGDQFSEQDIVNLLERAGVQVGIGEGRNDSKSSHGMGWGSFEIEKG